jgi:hypothetical protein
VGRLCYWISDEPAIPGAAKGQIDQYAPRRGGASAPRLTLHRVTYVPLGCPCHVVAGH